MQDHVDHTFDGMPVNGEPDRGPTEQAFPGTNDPRTVAEVDAEIKAENAATKGADAAPENK